MRSSIGLVVLLAACSAGFCRGRQLSNITIYRLTPVNYTGVTNMDTGDAAGDAMFGLNQLLLPQLCLVDPGFLWCGNRRYLSDGNAKMVYTEFVVETDSRFGDYNACNPNSETGIFGCISFSNSSGTPEQCAAGYEIYHEDCLNGTVLHSFKSSDAKVEGACCAACTNAGSNCSGWNIGPLDKGARTCQLLTGKTKDWSGAQATHDCKAAVSDPHAYECWNTNPAFNTTFNDVCEQKECYCDAVERKSVGRELHAMCDHDQSASGLSMTGGHNKWFNYLDGLACLLDGGWYSTQDKGECKGGSIDDHCWWRLAETHRTVNSSCVDDRMVAAVQKHRPQCWAACPQPSNRTTACYLDCLFETMLGKEGYSAPLSKEQIVEPFLQAFKSAQEGGCPDVRCQSDDDCKLSGDKTAYCKSSGSCQCDEGFFGQFCSRSSSSHAHEAPIVNVEAHYV